MVTETVLEENTDGLQDNDRNRKWTWKKEHRIGSWNVRSLNRLGAKEEFDDVMQNFNMTLVALQEVRWPGKGLEELKNGWLYYSGKEDGKKEEGVAFYLKKSLKSNVIEFEAINSRLARIRLKSTWLNITALACYAPTEVSDEEAKDNWYSLLETVMMKIPRHDLLVLLGDFNAKVGRETQAFSPAIGENSLHVLSNNNGVRLATFALQYGLVIGGTIFPHKDSHKGTWISPSGGTINQIDHIFIRQKHRIPKRYLLFPTTLIGHVLNSV